MMTLNIYMNAVIDQNYPLHLYLIQAEPALV